MRVEVERQMRQFYKECQREENELRQQILKSAAPEADATALASTDGISGRPK